jgi:hypothetical protein
MRGLFDPRTGWAGFQKILRGESSAGGMIWEKRAEMRQCASFIDRRGLVISVVKENSSERKKEGTLGQLKNKFSNLRKDLGVKPYLQDKGCKKN